MPYNFEIYKEASDLPADWNSIIGCHNMMLSTEYLHALGHSGPGNMDCYMAGFFENDRLIGGALFQYLDFQYHSSFQKNKAWFDIRNMAIRKFSKDIMVLGNNMLTGQNGFYFDLSRISLSAAVLLLEKAARKMQKEIRKTSLIIYKDYRKDFMEYFMNGIFRSYYRFSVQPNMVLNLKESWKNFEGYMNGLSSKYRSRARSARKKIPEISKFELGPDEIKKYEPKINWFYQNVAGNARFNTFFLAENHFKIMKESLQERFKVFGYFSGEELIGFYTLILNGTDIDTYFLGYDKELQKEKQLYLNMLLDMVEFGICQNFRRIIFGRTALEIKSTIGAEPVEIFGLIRHRNLLINGFMGRIFTSFNPKTVWVQRNPFKDD